MDAGSPFGLGSPYPRRSFGSRFLGVENALWLWGSGWVPGIRVTAGPKAEKVSNKLPNASLEMEINGKIVDQREPSKAWLPGGSVALPAIVIAVVQTVHGIG